jgi:sRNA-binding protein
LAIGVTASIMAQMKTATYNKTSEEVCLALAHWTKTDAYLRACTAGAIRVNLEGAPAGVVSEQEARFAAMELEKRE